MIDPCWFYPSPWQTRVRGDRLLSTGDIILLKERGPVLSAERGELVDIQIQGDDGEMEEGFLEMKGIAGEATGFEVVE